MIMIHDLPDFPSYKYDDSVGIVLSYYEKNKKGELKWSIINGKKRVTLWRNKNPHYKFENQVLKMAGQTQMISKESAVENFEKIQKQTEKVKEKVKQKTNKQVIEKKEQVIEEINNQVSEEFSKKWLQVVNFLNERQKPFRRDQFQVKFGKEFLEECIEKDLVEEIKIASFKFYNLKK